MTTIALISKVAVITGLIPFQAVSAAFSPNNVGIANINNEGIQQIDVSNVNMRSLQLDNIGNITSDSICHLCNSPDTRVYEDVVGYENFTCGDLNVYALSLLRDSEDCTSIQAIGPVCCEFKPMYLCETALRSELFGDDSSYDTAVAPLGSNRRLTVNVSMDFLHLSSVDIQTSTAEIFTWLHLVWNDPRLAYNPSSTGGCFVDSINVYASLDVETTEIWTPDYNLYNLVNGVQSMGSAKATVYPDGTVLWSRNGGIKAICSFSGLDAIPFDELGCELLWGGWTRQNEIDHEMLNGTFYTVNDDLWQNYMPYKLMTDRIQAYYTDPPYKGMIGYKFFVRRAKRFYIQKIVVPTILFTYTSFGVYNLDIRLGERFGYVISLLLVIVASDIITSSMLPTCDEHLWLDTLSLYSTFFVMFGLFETVIVGYLHYLDLEDDDEEEAEEEKKRIEQIFKKEVLSKDVKLSSFVETGSSLDNQLSSTKISSPMESDDLKSTSSTVKKTSKRSISDVFFKARKRSESWQERRIRQLDRFCIFFVTTSYTIFLIVMFATRNRSKDN